MFACLYSLSTPLTALVALAESFTPRFEVTGPLVMLDVSGLSRLLGSFKEIGDQLRRASPGPVRIAIAPTQTAAALLALSRAGLTVIDAGGQAAALAPLPVGVLGDLDRLNVVVDRARPPAAREPRPASPVSPPPSIAPPPAPRKDTARPPHVGEMWDALPYFESTLERTSELAVKAHCGGGWSHPRDSHAARLTRQRRGGTAIQGTEHPHAATVKSATATLDAPSAPPVNRRAAESMSQALDLLQTLRRWGIKTLGALAGLPPGEVYGRLGARGVAWQRLARGEDTSPMVPWIPEDPFESSLALEWPIEGLEPLSFVLGRLLEPLSARLEQADRGAAILHTHLRLVSKEVHARTVQLPAPMRDAKTLRTLVLLDLESHPPAAAIDRVVVAVDPTPARILQYSLLTRPLPSPEQVSTLMARLNALMGEGRCGSPSVVDSWRPGAFAMAPFAPVEEGGVGRVGRVGGVGKTLAEPADSQPQVVVALRRFRFAVPARVQVDDGRPVRVTTERRGLGGGRIDKAAGPWRTSGQWWAEPFGLGEAGKAGGAGRSENNTPWDRDEWDVTVNDGATYRLFRERDANAWFIDGVLD